MGAVLTRISPPSFKPERDIPDQTGKVIIVTGGNTGIGYETVKQLLLKNATVYLAARSAEKAAAAIARLKTETNGREAVFLELDLADLPSVKKSAQTFLAREEKLHVLINNAGVMNCPTDMLTNQGYDMQFGTNVIGHYLFTTLLLPALRKAATDTVPARAIHVSSAGHMLAPGRGIEFASITGSKERDRWVKAKGGFLAPWWLYGQSKLGNIYLANYFAKTYPDVLVSCSLHPGVIRSELQRHSAGWMQVIGNGIFYPTPLGALTQLWGATIATPAQVTGQYLVPWGRVATPDKRARDVKMEDEMIVFVKDAVKEYI
ncbi:Short-chain dehydrogenase/reductase family protein [Mycena indigotica]|uniref:Short-chain dehydrogenase/reductase family protein n=1 Tax=Mycena indigotica TaxID=2126181 RepID=A0A8H6SR31_9AGAR|nr:Short-chain dehydrogenase/reductase family protein [Mycena indigotica]KAF7303495.1 Short-chain dehydrogenase/reductase family protein [Mycena indigotica]